jgi:hypothetical protein
MFKQDGTLSLSERKCIGTTTRTWVRQLNSVVFPIANEANVMGTIVTFEGEEATARTGKFAHYVTPNLM